MSMASMAPRWIALRCQSYQVAVLSTPSYPRAGMRTHCSAVQPVWMVTCLPDGNQYHAPIADHMVGETSMHHLGGCWCATQAWRGISDGERRRLRPVSTAVAMHLPVLPYRLCWTREGAAARPCRVGCRWGSGGRACACRALRVVSPGWGYSATRRSVHSECRKNICHPTPFCQAGACRGRRPCRGWPCRVSGAQGGSHGHYTKCPGAP